MANERWEAGETHRFDGLTVSLSSPVLVGRSSSWLWFPSVSRLSNGEYLAKLYATQDMAMYAFSGLVAWSANGGLSWSEPAGATHFGPSSLNTPDGDHLILPFDLRPLSDGSHGAPHNVIPRGERVVSYQARKVKVTGFPRPIGEKSSEIGSSALAFDGQVITSRDGAYLTTLYGRFAGDKRESTVLAESRNGLEWRFRSVIGAADYDVPGTDGPSETALCRLRDGRLFSVFRLKANRPYAKVWSEDDGRTWTTPVLMEGMCSVQPRMHVMQSGALVLVGGRPGIHLWVDRRGIGERWEHVDVTELHNKLVPDEPIARPNQTSAYTEVAELDGENLLYLYDRIPYGWDPVPEESTETNSVWAMKVTVAP